MKTGENLCDFGFDKDFLGITVKAQSIKNTDKLDFIKIKTLPRRTVKKRKRQATKIFANCISEKDFYPEYLNKSQNSLRQTSDLKNRQKI